MFFQLIRTVVQALFGAIAAIGAADEAFDPVSTEARFRAIVLSSIQIGLGVYSATSAGDRLEGIFVGLEYTLSGMSCVVLHVAAEHGDASMQTASAWLLFAAICSPLFMISYDFIFLPAMASVSHLGTLPCMSHPPTLRFKRRLQSVWTASRLGAVNASKHASWRNGKLVGRALAAIIYRKATASINPPDAENATTTKAHKEPPYVVLQTAWRRHAAMRQLRETLVTRTEMRAMQDAREALAAAATIIQSRWRGASSRRRFGTPEAVAMTRIKKRVRRWRS